jgi:23S rRNA (uridine2552-2'-O)-methyltransferase
LTWGKRRYKKRQPGSTGGWQDHYTRRALKEGYPARSAYKLEEIQQRHRVLRPGDRVLDLGCAPGSWLMVAARWVGDRGRVTGVDLKPVRRDLPENAGALTGDVFDLADAVLSERFDVVLSDMAPDTTGNRVVDAARSLALSEAALHVARERLRPGGRFVCKIFQGEDFQAFSAAVRETFQEHAIFKPLSTRKSSREVYLIGLGKR